MTDAEKAKAVYNHVLYTRRRGYRRTQLLAKIKNRPCMDCQGWLGPCQMEFDHRPGVEKIRDVSRMRGCTLKRLLAEAAKCDIVCANCHKLRTTQRKLRLHG